MNRRAVVLLIVLTAASAACTSKEPSKAATLGADVGDIAAADVAASADADATSSPVDTAQADSAQPADVASGTDVATTVDVTTPTDMGSGSFVATEGPPGIAPLLLESAPNGDVYISGVAAGLFKTTDHGATWKGVNTGLASTTTVSGLSVAANGDVYAASVLLHKSTDAAATFNVTYWPAVAGTAQTFAWAAPSGPIYTAGFDAGACKLKRSADAGATFTDTTATFGVNCPGFMAENGTEVWALANNAGAFRSTDSGVTFTEAGTGLPNKGFGGIVLSGGKFYLGSTGVWVFDPAQSKWLATGLTTGVYSVAAGPNGRLYALGTDGKARKSTDAGATWTAVAPVASVPIGTVLRYLTVAANGDVFVAYNSTLGVWRSIDEAATFSDVTGKLFGLLISDLAVKTGGSASAKGDIYASGGEGLYRSKDSGATWSKSVGSLGQFLGGQRVAVDPTGVILAGGGAGLARSTDDGATFTTTSTAQVVGLAVKAGAAFLTAQAGGNAMFKSTDAGATWTKLTTFPYTMIGGPGPILFAPNGDLLHVKNGDGLYRSTDNGTTFTQVAKAPAFSVMSSDGTTLWGVTYFQPVLKSTDNGATWKPTTALPGGFQVGHVLAKPGVVYARANTLLDNAAKKVGETAIFASTDGGASWTDVSASMSHREITRGAVDAAGTFFVGMNAGVWRQP